MLKVYKKRDPDSPKTIEEIINTQYNYQRKNTALDASKVSYREALCGRKYRKATFIVIMLQSFHQWTGNSSVRLYATRLLMKMEE